MTPSSNTEGVFSCLFHIIDRKKLIFAVPQLKTLASRTKSLAETLKSVTRYVTNTV